MRIFLKAFSFTVKAPPSPGVLLTLISPPVRSITRFTSAGPRPLPSVAWDVTPRYSSIHRNAEGGRKYPPY